MINIFLTSKFNKNFKRLPKNIQRIAIKKISIFQENPFMPILKTHKLTGELKDKISFSINNSYRILFRYKETPEKKAVEFLDVGTHSIYK